MASTTDPVITPPLLAPRACTPTAPPCTATSPEGREAAGRGRDAALEAGLGDRGSRESEAVNLAMAAVHLLPVGARDGHGKRVGDRTFRPKYFVPIYTTQFGGRARHKEGGLGGVGPRRRGGEFEDGDAEKEKSAREHLRAIYAGKIGKIHCLCARRCICS